MIRVRKLNVRKLNGEGAWLRTEHSVHKRGPRRERQRWRWPEKIQQGPLWRRLPSHTPWIRLHSRRLAFWSTCNTLATNHSRDSLSLSSVCTSTTEGSYEILDTNLLCTMAMLSYLTSLLTMRSATPAASANVGMSRPIWLNVNEMFFGRARESWALDLSPMTIIGESESTGFSLSAIVRRVNLETDEWIPPQRPLSEEMTMNSLCLDGLSTSEFWNTSAKIWHKIVQRNTLNGTDLSWRDRTACH